MRTTPPQPADQGEAALVRRRQALQDILEEAHEQRRVAAVVRGRRNRRCAGRGGSEGRLELCDELLVQPHLGDALWKVRIGEQSEEK